MVIRFPTEDDRAPGELETRVDTAHELGMFRYSQKVGNGEETVAYIHLEALLVKKDGGWKILMENQKSEGTKEEWENLK